MASRRLPPPAEGYPAIEDNKEEAQRRRSLGIKSRTRKPLVVLNPVNGGARWIVRFVEIGKHLTSWHWGDGDLGAWRNRIRQFADDMESDPNIILAEGFFEVSPTVALCTLVKMRYLPDTPKHEKYEVLSSLSRLRGSSTLFNNEAS